LTTGRANTGLGRDTGQCCVTGSHNIALGYCAMGGGAPVGLDKKIACWWNGSFDYNIAIGLDAGHDLVDSSANTLIGHRSGRPVKTGSWNTFIGYNCAVTMESNRSYNNKKLILMDPFDEGTYIVDGTRNITITYPGHQAQVGNYVVFYCSNGVIRTITQDRQLLYVTAVNGDSFVVESPVPITGAGGNVSIREYEVNIPEGETIGRANSSNIMGVGACYSAIGINQSNVFGMRTASRTYCETSNIIGFSQFYGASLANIDSRCEYSDIIGGDCCYNTPLAKYVQIIGYAACYNTATRLEESFIGGYNACYDAPDVYKSNIMGTNACKGNTVTIQQSIVNGGYAGYASGTITKSQLIGHNAGHSLTLANESTIIGEGCCKTVGSVATSNIIGQGVFFNGGGYTVTDSDVMGVRANYNTKTMAYSVSIGRGCLTNSLDVLRTVAVAPSGQANLTNVTECTFIGYAAGAGGNLNPAITSLTNTTAIGFAATASGDNQVQLGNGSTTTYVYGTVQNRSDIRDKIDVSDIELGLDWINKLRPVQYRWDYRESYSDIEYEIDENGNKNIVYKPVEKDGSRAGKRKHCGFIAQEIESLINSTGKDFGGYQDHLKNGGGDVKSLGYDEFIAPMVKAIQELSDKYDNLNKKYLALQKSIKAK
jgi:hypothetical protein